MQSKVFDNTKGRRVWPKRTICEVHRELYDLLVLNRPDEMLPKLEEAYMMGIELVQILIAHKCSLPEWKDSNSVEAIELRKLRIEINELSNSI